MGYLIFIILMLSSLLAFNASGQTQAQRPAQPAEPTLNALVQTAILGAAQERMPKYGEVENFTIVGYSDLNGWDKPTEIRVSPDGKWAFTAHNPPISEHQPRMGGSIIDVSNPAKPRVVARVDSGPGTHSQYIDAIGNTLVLNQERLRVPQGQKQPEKWEPGIRLFDISDPTKPKEVGFFRSDDLPGAGVHGFWLHEDPKHGKLAFLATSKQGYFGNILMIVDINNPAQPKEVARWSYPGTGPGEKQGENWLCCSPQGLLPPGMLPKIWTFVHDVTVYKDRAYLAYRDQGVVILDISEITQPKMVGQVKWSPPEQGNTHSIGVVIPPHGGRPDLLIASDEIFQCPYGYMHIIDVRYEANPVQIAAYRLPSNRHCPPKAPSTRGIHDIERMIRGNIVFSAWEGSGFWAVDISDPYRPKTAGYFIPPAFTRAKSEESNADDVFVHSNGLIFGSSSDDGGGLWILKYTPGVKGTISWTADKKNVVFKKR